MNCFGEGWKDGREEEERSWKTKDAGEGSGVLDEWEEGLGACCTERSESTPRRPERPLPSPKGLVHGQTLTERLRPSLHFRHSTPRIPHFPPFVCPRFQSNKVLCIVCSSRRIQLCVQCDAVSEAQL